MPEDEFAELRRQFVLNDTIVHLLAERAEQSDLAVSYDEVRCYIVNWHQGYVVKGERLCQQFPEWYQERYVNTDLRFYSEVDGSFSDSYARDVRVNFGMAVEEYEAGKARELLALKYLDLVRGMIEVAPEEVAALHARRNETVDLEFVRLDPASAAIGEITDEDVATFLAENAAEVQASYDGRVDEFSTARQVRDSSHLHPQAGRHGHRGAGCGRSLLPGGAAPGDRGRRGLRSGRARAHRAGA